MVVKTFGDICNNTDECSDHRYACMLDTDNIYRCICDKFHKWMGDQYGCIQTVNVTEILKNVTNAYNFDELIEREATVLYRQNAAAGLFVVVVFMIVAIVVIYYGLHIEYTDLKLKKSLLKCHNEHKSTRQPQMRKV